MMYHIPDVLSTDQVAEFTRSWRRPSGSTGGLRWVARGGRQTEPADRYPNAAVCPPAGRCARYAARPSAVFSAALPRTISAPLFNRYGPGETYGFHVDGAVRQNGEAGWMRTDLSATLFLCDPESYEGGELVIEDTYGQHRVKLPSASGALSRQQPALRHRSPAASARPLSCGSSRWSATISSVRCFTTWTAPSSL